jgi:predicted nucleic acid-binding protein
LEASYFEQLFALMKNYQFDDRVASVVIELRRTYSLQLPDVITAASAIANDFTLWTHNTDDFDRNIKSEVV